MTLTNNIALALAVTTALFCIAVILGTTPRSFASAPSGLPATVATTSRATVTATAALVFATSTCSARVISTSSSSIMIGFSDNQGFVPTANQGIYQAASTTVAYDSGQYGCQAVRVFSFSTQTIGAMESN